MYCWQHGFGVNLRQMIWKPEGPRDGLVQHTLKIAKFNVCSRHLFFNIIKVCEEYEPVSCCLGETCVFGVSKYFWYSRPCPCFKSVPFAIWLVVNLSSKYKVVSFQICWLCSSLIGEYVQPWQTRNNGLKSPKIYSAWKLHSWDGNPTCWVKRSHSGSRKTVYWMCFP